jgi:hypothetical protein
VNANASKFLLRYVAPILLGFAVNELLYFLVHSAWWFNLLAALIVACLSTSYIRVESAEVNCSKSYPYFKKAALSALLSSVIFTVALLVVSCLVYFIRVESTKSWPPYETATKEWLWETSIRGVFEVFPFGVVLAQIPWVIRFVRSYIALGNKNKVHQQTKQDKPWPYTPLEEWVIERLVNDYEQAQHENATKLREEGVLINLKIDLDAMDAIEARGTTENRIRAEGELEKIKTDMLLVSAAKRRAEVIRLKRRIRRGDKEALDIYSRILYGENEERGAEERKRNKK